MAEAARKAEAARDYVVTRGSVFVWPKREKGSRARAQLREVPKGTVLKLTKGQAKALVGKVKLKAVADAEKSVVDAEGAEDEELPVGQIPGEPEAE